MKFTDGNWMMQPGVQARYAAEAYEVRAGRGEIVFIVPTTRIRHRGDTLSGPVLTVRLSSPMPDIVRVRAHHFAGIRDTGPHFEVAPDSPEAATVEETADYAALTSGRLCARVPKGGDWRLDFLGAGVPIARSEPRGLATVRTADGASYIHEQLTLDVGECIYGLGERFTAFVKNGQVVETWNKDGGAGSEQAYKSVPFYLTNRGYGVFVADPGNVEFEAASEKVSRMQFSVPGEILDYYVIYGPTPKEILSKYTALTGRPALPPAWTFGLWLTTSFTTSYDEATVNSFLDGMADRDLPLHVFHFDCFWMREFRWCDFEWDPRTFPNPRAMLARLKARGLRVCVWINSYIAQESRLFAEGAARDYLLTSADGNVRQTDQWQPGMGIVDFTNPDACSWYAGHLEQLLDDGVDCFKTDFGERIPTDVVYHDGSDPAKMHNYYAQLYNKTVFDLLVRKRGPGEAAVFARSATAGGQQYPVHWGGDCFSNFGSMSESLRGGLSLGLSGFGYWSHDIGGFEGTPPAAVYKRWLAFGLLSSHSRLHGSSSYRVPWIYDDEAVDVLRRFTKLKCSLMPYLFAKAVEAHETGVPMMRAMTIEFPDDPAVAYLDRQYMLGDALLVAPIFHDDGHVDYYVPAGQWTRFDTAETVVGPKWVRENHGFMSLPLLVRPNSLVAIGAVDDKPDYDFAAGAVVRIYALDDGAEAAATVPNLDGAAALTITARRRGNVVEIAATGRADATWQALLVAIRTPRTVDGAQSAVTDAGVLLTPNAPLSPMRVEIA